MFLWRSLTPAVLASTVAKPKPKPLAKVAAPAKPASDK
jgi:hypothetical protein